MIELTDTIEDIMKVTPQLTVRPDKVLLKIEGKQTVTIPSKLYPLQNKKTIQFYHHNNTEPIEDERVLGIFDSLTFEKGRCYTNAEKIEAAFKEAGLSEKIKTMTGWLISPDGTPVHHSWAIYEDVHVLDPAGHIAQYHLMMSLKEEKQKLPQDEMRHRLIKGLKEAEGKPNRDVLTCGQALPIFVYVGSETTPDTGRRVFQKLVKDYPDHPTYVKPGMNRFGESETQRLYREETQ